MVVRIENTVEYPGTIICAAVLSLNRRNDEGFMAHWIGQVLTVKNQYLEYINIILLGQNCLGY
ncbi:hypothetical protein SAMN05216318_10798 [Nitrosomonas eutropha]|nr:hypothetical protein SAMN05216318_10798 [Nitrosomonas eutropha]